MDVKNDRDDKSNFMNSSDGKKGGKTPASESAKKGRDESRSRKKKKTDQKLLPTRASCLTRRQAVRES